MRLKSIRFKITVLFSAVLSIILALYSSLLYFNLSYVIYRELDINLREKVNYIGNVLNTYAQMLDQDQQEIPRALRRTLHLDAVEATEILQWPKVKAWDAIWKHNMQTLGIKSDFVVVYDRTGKLIDSFDNIEENELEELRKGLDLSALGNTNIKNLILKDTKLRVISYPYKRAGQVQYVIQLATSLDKIAFIFRNKLKLILVTVPVVLLLTIFLGRFFVIRTFRPITQITQTAEAISYEDMSKRVPQEHADEEISALVKAFNNMIARLEKSFKYIEEFSSEVAHELKTPLAIIRGESEVALRKERTPGEYKKVIGVIIDEIQRMLKTINDLLLLTKLNYRPDIFKFEEFDLIEFFGEIYEQARIIASEKNIEVVLAAPQGPINIRANNLHLRRLFFNLIDNAVKFTPPQGKIGLAIRCQDKNAFISVADTGAGIREEDLPHIFDRFFSADRGDQVSETATGLGLNIVQSIAKIHQGSVEVRSSPGEGTVFTVRLPLL